MEVIILGKTHFGKLACVGGLVLTTNQYVRLLSSGGWYQYADTDFNIGDIWDITFSISKEIKPPHVEDVIIHTKRFVRCVENIAELLLQSGVPIWRGSINNVFDGKIIWAKSGSGYLSVNKPDYPSHSVGFWISDKPLHFEDDHYIYREGNKKLVYKGFPAAIDSIPANTLLRVSLPKWWKPKDTDVEERCYLQLSGWYDK